MKNLFCQSIHNLHSDQGTTSQRQRAREQEFYAHVEEDKKLVFV